MRLLSFFSHRRRQYDNASVHRNNSTRRSSRSAMDGGLGGTDHLGLDDSITSRSIRFSRSDEELNLYGRTESLAFNFPEVNVQRRLLYHPLLYPPSYRPAFSARVRKNINDLLASFCHETRNDFDNKENKHPPYTVEPMDKDTFRPVDEEAWKILKDALNISSTFSVGFSSTRLSASMGTRLGTAEEYAEALRQVRSGDKSILTERKRWMNKHGYKGELNHSVIEKLGAWYQGPAGREDGKTTYKQYVTQVLEDKIYDAFPGQAEVITILHSCGESEKEARHRKGTLVVYVCIDRTADYKEGMFMAGNQMAQYKLDWMLTIEDVPQWLWKRECAQKFLSQARDELFPKLNTTVMTYKVEENDGIPEVDWKVETNDVAWKWFSQARMEEIPPEDATRSARAAFCPLTGNGVRAAGWTKWVNRRATEKGAKAGHGQETTMIGDNPRQLQATVGQILCIVSVNNEVPPRYCLPQMCFTDAFCWKGGTSMVCSSVGYLTYKLAAIGRLPEIPAQIPSNKERDVQLIARWKADIIREVADGVEPGVIGMTSSVLTNFAIWD